MAVLIDANVRDRPAGGKKDVESIGVVLDREVTPVLRQARKIINDRIGSLVKVTADYTVAPGIQVVLCDCTAGAITVTLPNPSRTTMRIGVKKIDSSGSAVTVSSSGATIDGAASATLSAANDSIEVVSDGEDYWQL